MTLCVNVNVNVNRRRRSSLVRAKLCHMSIGFDFPASSMSTSSFTLLGRDPEKSTRKPEISLLINDIFSAAAAAARCWGRFSSRPGISLGFVERSRWRGHTRSAGNWKDCNGN